MRRALRASYTVEAAIIMPIVLIVIGVILERGIDMYRRIGADFGAIDADYQTEARHIVDRLQTAEDILEELGWK